MMKTDPFRGVYDANHRHIRDLLARMVGPQDAEDLVQAVFVKAAKALPTFRGEARTSTWLHCIAVSVASDWLRSRSRHEAKLTVPLPGASDEDIRAAASCSVDVGSPPSPRRNSPARTRATSSAAKSGNFPTLIALSSCSVCSAS